MAVDTVIIQEVFHESPRLTYRARSRETFGSNLEVFAEEEEASVGGSGQRTRRSTTGSSPGEASPQNTPRQNGEWHEGGEGARAANPGSLRPHSFAIVPGEAAACSQSDALQLCTCFCAARPLGCE